MRCPYCDKINNGPMTLALIVLLFSNAALGWLCLEQQRDFNAICAISDSWESRTIAAWAEADSLRKELETP